MCTTAGGLSVLDLADLFGAPPRKAAFQTRFGETVRGSGFFYLVNHGIPDELCQAVLAMTRLFFELPEQDKQRMHIDRSPNFRGYSVMENDRDWREQLHFGWEWPEGAWAPGRPEHYRLAGANPWPFEPPGFGSLLGAYLDHCRRLGDVLLGVYATGLGLPEDHFLRLSQEPPYLLLKQIAYRPQMGPGQREGVAGHCDWSWFTLLLQDDVGGLAVLDGDGRWQGVTPLPGTLTVTTGELMAYASGGQFRATPHRVANPSTRRTRYSVPVFINPALDARVACVVPPSARVAAPLETEHIHRVLAPGWVPPPFVFGASEWRRKGQGRWCHLCTRDD